VLRTQKTRAKTAPINIKLSFVFAFSLIVFAFCF
jgi:hypothetical protein